MNTTTTRIRRALASAAILGLTGAGLLAATGPASAATQPAPAAATATSPAVFAGITVKGGPGVFDHITLYADGTGDALTHTPAGAAVHGTVTWWRGPDYSRQYADLLTMSVNAPDGTWVAGLSVPEASGTFTGGWPLALPDGATATVTLAA